MANLALTANYAIPLSADTAKGVTAYGYVDQAVKTASSPTFAGLTISGLTSGRIALVGTAGLLTDSSTFTFNPIAGQFLIVQNAAKIGRGTTKVGVGTNASGNEADGRISVISTGTNDNLILNAKGSGEVIFNLDSANAGVSIQSANKTIASDTYNMRVLSTDAYAINKGGMIGFGGNYDTGLNTIFGAISGRKENATQGNISGYLSFVTRANGANPTERMRIGSDGTVTLSAYATAGILHNAVTTGIVSSSLIVNADIDSGALIELSKLEEIADVTIVGNFSGAVAVPVALTTSDIKKMLGQDEEGFITSTLGAGNGYSSTAFGTDSQVPIMNGTSTGFAYITGAGGSFTTADGKTVTVTNGIITAIV